MKEPKALHELCAMMIEHYEFPLYHPAKHHDVRRELLRYAHQIGEFQFVLGYIQKARKAAEEAYLTARKQDEIKKCV